MDRSSVVGALLALLVGLAIGAAALSWWEGGRQSAEVESLKVRLSDERAEVQGKIKAVTDELAAEKQRREALEQVVQQAESGKRR
jgi:vacuolar-type H+-ATPase subunit I/STV1